MKIPQGSAVNIRGVVVNRFGDERDEAFQSVVVQLADGQSVHTNVRNVNLVSTPTAEPQPVIEPAEADQNPPEGDSDQCTGLTRSGERCKHDALPGTDRCKQHPHEGDTVTA